MKAFLVKNIYLIVLFAGIALTMPFVKFIQQAAIEEVMEDGYSHITYERLSGIDVVWEGTVSLFTEDNNSRQQLFLLTLYFILGLIALSQVIGAALRSDKIILYTAIVLFSALFAVMVFLQKRSHDTTVSYGYYIYLIIQALLIVLVPKTLKKVPDQENK